MFAFDESLFAFAYKTPPLAFALLFDRYTHQCFGKIRLLFFIFLYLRDVRKRDVSVVINANNLHAIRFSPFRYALYSFGNALNAATLIAMTMAPRKASRQPMYALAFDES